MVEANEGGLESTILCSLKLKAIIVEPHPKLAEVWLLTDGTNIGIVSADHSSNPASFGSYEQLSLHATIDEGSVTDISFSADGAYIAAAVPYRSGLSAVEIWRLPTSDFLVRGEGNLHKMPTTIRTAELIAVKFLSCGIVTAARATVGAGDGGSKKLNVLMHVWPFDGAAEASNAAATAPIAVASQLIRVSLPAHPDASDCTTSATQLALSSTGKFLVLSHRQSHLVVCFVADPNVHTHTHHSSTGLPRIPLVHATFLDLKFPVYSADTTIIAGRNHHSDAEVEHLEVRKKYIKKKINIIKLNECCYIYFVVLSY
jgi:hypothetical protein